jgi:putative chitinase
LISGVRALNKLLPDYGIDTPQRVASFLAQCAHESGGFVFLKENLNYRAASLRKIFPKYFPTDALAEQYASQPNKAEAIANRIYANRMGNGPEESGDGFATADVDSYSSQARATTQTLLTA